MAKKVYTASLTTTLGAERKSSEERFGNEIHNRFAAAAMAFGTEAPAPTPAPHMQAPKEAEQVASVVSTEPVVVLVTSPEAVVEQPIAAPQQQEKPVVTTREAPKLAAPENEAKRVVAEKQKERQGFLGAPGTFVESVSVCREDSERIEEYRFRLARQRMFATKAEIFRAGLLALNSLSDDEVIKLIKDASRFRPTKKERKRAT